MPTYASLTDDFADGLARICGIYGISPLTGRLWGVLFLAPGPVALEDLAERVGAAKSTVSVAVRKLEDARVVRRSWRKGDRRDFYEAITDPDTVLRQLLDRYVRPEIAVWEEIDAAALAALRDPIDGLDDAHRAELVRRIRAMDAFLAVCERALASVEVEVARPSRSIKVEFE